MSEIQWVRHGRAPATGAQEELVSGPLMQRVADRCLRVGIAYARGLKDEAGGIGQVGEGCELAVGARQTCRWIAHPVQPVEPGRHEQREVTA